MDLTEQWIREHWHLAAAVAAVIVAMVDWRHLLKTARARWPNVRSVMAPYYGDWVGINQDDFRLVELSVDASHACLSTGGDVKHGRNSRTARWYVPGARMALGANTSEVILRSPHDNVILTFRPIPRERQDGSTHVHEVHVFWKAAGKELRAILRREIGSEPSPYAHEI